MTNVAPAIRDAPPLVGLALGHSAPADLDPAASDAFDARIMHRQVPADLRTWRVLCDADDALLSRALGVDSAVIQGEWLTSRTPLVDPRLSAAAKAKDKTLPRARPSFVALSLDTLQRYRDLAYHLRSRLESVLLSEQTPPRNTDKYYSHKPLKPLTSLSIDDDEYSTYPGQGDTANTISTESGVGSFEPSSLLSNSASSRYQHLSCCGFNCLGKHVQKAPCTFEKNSGVVVRASGGLYSGAKHSQAIVRGGESVYTEIEVLYSGGSGGIAVGIAEEHYPLDCMVGAKRQSMALHSSGKIVTNGKWCNNENSMSDDNGFGTGDIVGLLVSHSKTGKVVMRATVNGRYAGEITGETQTNRVYVMASMLKQGARVLLRCCREEWRYAPFNQTAAKPVCAPSICSTDDDEAAIRNNNNNHIMKRNEDTTDNTSAVLTP